VTGLIWHVSIKSANKNRKCRLFSGLRSQANCLTWPFPNSSLELLKISREFVLVLLSTVLLLLLLCNPVGSINSGAEGSATNLREMLTPSNFNYFYLTFFNCATCDTETFTIHNPQYLTNLKNHSLMTSVSSPICNGCGEGPRGNSKLLICSRCSKAWYHDAHCQRQHYPEHKSECRQIVMHPKFHQSQSDKILLSFTEGLQVIDSGGELGKVAIASCDFFPLDVVLLEPPAIVFDEENGYFGLFDAFLGASSEVKKGILQMENGGESVLADPVEYQGIMRDMLVDSEMRRYTLQNPSAARNLTGDLPNNLVRIVGICTFIYPHK